MTNQDLQAARIKLKLNKADMARMLKTPYRTYQDWEANLRRIPGVCQVAVELLLRKDEFFMAGVFERCEKRITNANSLQSAR